MNKNAVCTIVSLNYFAQAQSLMRNMRNYHEDLDLYILIVDVPQNEEVKRMLEGCEGLAKIVYVCDIGIENFTRMAFQYDVVELNTAVKPFFLTYLLKNQQYETVLYIDSDILFFNRLDGIFQYLEQYSVVLTPHLLSDEEDMDTAISKTDDFLQYGIYNLGFLGVKNDETGKRLLSWWGKKLSEKCLLEPAQFLAWDQKWMDFVPALFDNVYVLRDPGYNVAFWNLQKRYISKKDGTFYINEKFPLFFYHFSHYRLTRKDRIVDLEPESRCVSISKRKDLVELFSIYYESVRSENFEYYNKIRYGYSCYSNGVEISKEDRRLYYLLPKKEKERFSNPFDSLGEESFYACKETLRTCGSSNSKPEKEKECG